MGGQARRFRRLPLAKSAAVRLAWLGAPAGGGERRVPGLHIGAGPPEITRSLFPELRWIGESLLDGRHAGGRKHSPGME